jgi:hypothetical protein
MIDSKYFSSLSISTLLIGIGGLCFSAPAAYNDYQKTATESEQLKYVKKDVEVTLLTWLDAEFHCEVSFMNTSDETLSHKTFAGTATCLGEGSYMRIPLQVVLSENAFLWNPTGEVMYANENECDSKHFSEMSSYLKTRGK